MSLNMKSKHKEQRLTEASGTEGLYWTEGLDFSALLNDLTNKWK